jgi:hypothetical protein
LWYIGGTPGAEGQQVQASFNWAESDAPAGTMRVNLFSLTAGVSNYGVSDFAATAGGSMTLPLDASYHGICYSYDAANKIYFRNENSIDRIEAYTTTMSRSSYTRAFPAEHTVRAVDEGVVFNLGRIERFDVTRSEQPLSMMYTPVNVLCQYSFEIDNVVGAEHIADLRAACSGMSSSYFLGTGSLSQEPATLFFGAAADVANATITGSFRTFGRLPDADNNFTLEVLTRGGEILQYTWDITPQVDGNGGINGNVNINNIHIVIDSTTPVVGDGDGQVVVPDGGGGNSGSGGGFSADVNEWDEEMIELK